MTTEKSASFIELAKALCKFQGAMQSVGKDSENPFFKMRYASLDAIWDVCRKPLSENGLALVQTTVEAEGKILLETWLLHTSGEYMKTQLPLYPQKFDPQSVGSAITYARRYSMSAMLGISADEDDDAELATGKGRKKQVPAAAGTAEIHASKSLSPDDLLCPIHKAPFTRHEKDGKVWYSHKTPDGKWCNREDVQKAEVGKDKDDLFGPEQPAPASPQAPITQETPTLNTLGDLYTAGRRIGYQTKKDMLAILGVADDALIGDVNEAFRKLQEYRP